MTIETFCCGALQTNCYVLHGPDADRCLIVDPGDGPDAALSYIENAGLSPTAILLTHGHCDHIAGIPDVQARFPGTPVWVHEADASMLTNPLRNFALLMGRMLRVSPADRYLADAEIIQEAGLALHVLHTPGHSAGGLSFYIPQHHAVIAGDTLFAGSVGRTDFPGGRHALLIVSIREKLLTLPDDTKVYPGHGPITTIAQERRTNPFLQ